MASAKRNSLFSLYVYEKLRTLWLNLFCFQRRLNIADVSQQLGRQRVWKIHFSLRASRTQLCALYFAYRACSLFVSLKTDAMDCSMADYHNDEEQTSLLGLIHSLSHMKPGSLKAFGFLLRICHSHVRSSLQAITNMYPCYPIYQLSTRNAGGHCL